MKLRLTAAIVLVGAVAAFPGSAGAVEGPGSHWVDDSAGGTDEDIGCGGTIAVDTDLDEIADIVEDWTGTITVVRSDPLDDSLNYPGLRPVDGHLDVIDVDMTWLDGVAATLALRACKGIAYAVDLSLSTGGIAERPGNDFLADSFFDVYLELDLGGGTYAHNQAPITMTSVIDRFPPIATYDSGSTLIQLYDPTGLHIANLTYLTLTIPEPAVLTLLALGGLAFIIRKRRA